MTDRSESSCVGSGGSSENWSSRSTDTGKDGHLYNTDNTCITCSCGSRLLTPPETDTKAQTETKVCSTCVCPDMLDVVALAVREVGALAAGVQFAGEVIPQMFPPVVLTDGGVRTQSALKHPAETQHIICIHHLLYVQLLFTDGSSDYNF